MTLVLVLSVKTVMKPFNMILHKMDTLKLLMHEKNINYVEKKGKEYNCKECRASFAFVAILIISMGVHWINRQRKTTNRPTLSKISLPQSTSGGGVTFSHLLQVCLHFFQTLPFLHLFLFFWHHFVSFSSLHGLAYGKWY